METIEDIVLEMINLANLDKESDDMIPRKHMASAFLSHASRIKAAMKNQFRDTTKTIPEEVVVAKMETTTPTSDKSSQVGNTAKMREVCQKIFDILMSHGDGRQYCVLTWDEFNDAYMIIRDALAKPPRNCDVGTAEEQEERYLKLKREHVDRIARCPAEGSFFFPDSLYWAQMPYEKEGEK